VVLVERDAGVGPDAAPAVTLIDEREPNDTIAQAQVLEPGRGVRGHMDPSPAKHGDVDLYRLTLPAAGAAPPRPPGAPVAGGGAIGLPPAPGRAASQPTSGPIGLPGGPASAPSAPAIERSLVAVELSGVPGLDLALDVLDARGERLLTVNDGKAGAGETIPNLGLTAGTYYLRVRQPGKKPGADPAHAYVLSVTAAPLGPGEEIEPNDRPAWATELTPGGEVSGLLGWHRDEDWYRVPLTAAPEGGTLRVDYQGVTGVAASVAVYDSIRTKIAEAKGARGDRVALRSVAIKKGEPALFVLVRAEAGQSAELRYALRVAIDLPGEPTEIEPNDDRAHATPLEGSRGALSGYIAAPGDTDWFRLSSEGPALARVEVSCPERVDLKLAVHDASGAELWRADEGGRREPELVVNVPVKGSVYVRVFARPGDSNPDEPYRLTWKVEPDDGATEHEPNNTPARAMPVPPGGSVQGVIHPTGDVDFYRVAAPPDRPARLRATVRPIPKVNLVLSLFAATEAGVLGPPIATAKGSGPEEERVLEAELTPGTSYFLQVRDASGRMSNPRDSYTLRVDLQ
jgi:hypothetical protein